MCSVPSFIVSTVSLRAGLEPLTAEEQAGFAEMLPSFMLFAVVWSLGASCDKAGRALFDAHLRSLVPACNLQLPEGAMFPEASSVYDWFYNQEDRTWVKWMATIPEFKCDPELPFASIIVPTADTVRYTYLVDILLKANKHVLCVGETGTGKTLNVSNKLMSDMPPEFTPIFMTFSARTAANQIQDILDAKMEKRRKGVFGPPTSQRYVVFVDDLNMPMREKYFAQPPIELLRQWMDHEGWYERRPPCNFRTIVDTQFVSSMGPPGGGRNPVTNRFLRHFNFISFTEMSDESVMRIFTTILGAFFRKSFSEPIQGVTEQVVGSTIELYNNIRSQLLPTPSKSHYTFNLRDLSKVVQGVMRADKGSINSQQQVRGGEHRTACCTCLLSCNQAHGMRCESRTSSNLQVLLTIMHSQVVRRRVASTKVFKTHWDLVVLAAPAPAMQCLHPPF
jgi:dynein heavy chain, axonemal